jgi:hypothetical protein
MSLLRSSVIAATIRDLQARDAQTTMSSDSSPPSSHDFSSCREVASKIEAAVGPVENEFTDNLLAYSIPIELLHTNAALHDDVRAPRAQRLTGIFLNFTLFPSVCRVAM